MHSSAGLGTRGPVERIVADTCHEGKVLDVKTEIEGEPFAGGPVIEWPLFYGGVKVAAVGGQFQHDRKPL